SFTLTCLGKNLEPYTGLEFDTQDDAYSFYLMYAKCTGFGISKKSSHRLKLSREFIDAKFACTRYGIKRESSAINQRPCLKVDCKALLHVKRNSCGKWYVQNFIKEHNHELYPSHAHYFPCHRSIAFSNTHSINMLHAVSVGTNKIFAAMTRKNGGYKNIRYTDKDIRNHLDKERRLALKLGDARAMLNHFTQMQEENPNFFYAVDLDEEQRLKNIFWVDATSIEDYKIFGDVSFDTKFQVEVLGASACFSEQKLEVGIIKTFEVKDFEKIVAFMRWSKDAKSLDSTSNIPKGIQFKKQHFDKLFYQATKLSDEGLLSRGSFNIAYCALQDALEKCIRVNRSLKEHEVELDGAYKVDKENIDSNLLDDISILDPQISSTKEAPKRMNKRIEKCKKRILNTKSRKEHSATRDENVIDLCDTQDCLQEL
ncbi:hypothetical protein CUMW_238000, partial [Citrus unshiu]